MIGLERCADCRRVCTCYGECVCSTLDTDGVMRCHACTDVHDGALDFARLFPVGGLQRLAHALAAARGGAA